MNTSSIYPIFSGSLTDKSHCSSPLWSTYLRNELDEAVIIWQGAKIEECRVVRPFEETGQMCVRIVTNNISCDKNVTLTLFNQPLGDLVIMVSINLYLRLSYKYISNNL